MESVKERKDHYELVNHPNHYNQYAIEAIDMAERIYGTKIMAIVAEVTAFLYQIRVGSKPDNPAEQECEKIKWWLNKRDGYLKSLGMSKDVLKELLQE